MNIPILGKYLFGSNAKDKSRSELMVAIIPHIVRQNRYRWVGSTGRCGGTGSDVEATLRGKDRRAASCGHPGRASSWSPLGDNARDNAGKYPANHSHAGERLRPVLAFLSIPPRCRRT